jgi:hypothetical protein
VGGKEFFEFVFLVSVRIEQGIGLEDFDRFFSYSSRSYFPSQQVVRISSKKSEIVRMTKVSPMSVLVM